MFVDNPWGLRQIYYRDHKIGDETRSGDNTRGGIKVGMLRADINQEAQNPAGTTPSPIGMVPQGGCFAEHPPPPPPYERDGLAIARPRKKVVLCFLTRVVPPHAGTQILSRFEDCPRLLLVRVLLPLTWFELSSKRATSNNSQCFSILASPHMYIHPPTNPQAIGPLPISLVNYLKFLIWNQV